MRKLADNCGSLQGFFIFHSVGGGIGFGLDGFLLKKISINYGKKPKLGFSIYPSPKVDILVFLQLEFV